MKKLISTLVLIAVMLSASTALSATRIFEREYTYRASDADSKLTSRAIALEQVKRALLEELGTFLVSETTVKNMELTLDQVTTLSAGVVSTEIIDEKWDGITCWLKAQIKADPDEIAQSINDLKDDKQKVSELENSRQQAREANEELARLRAELEKLKNENLSIKETNRINNQYQSAANKLSATDWFNKAYAAKTPEDKIKAYSKAIEINPKYIIAYNNRGNHTTTSSNTIRPSTTITEPLKSILSMPRPTATEELHTKTSNNMIWPSMTLTKPLS